MKSSLRSVMLAVVVLAAGSAAQAATIDLTLSFNKTTGIAIDEVLTWTLSAVVSGNSYTLDGGPTVNAGFEGMSVGVSSTSNIIRYQEGQGPPPARLPTGLPSTAIYNTQTPPAGFGAPSLSMSPAYIANGGLKPVYLNLPLKSGYSDLNFTGDFSDLVPSLKLGNAAVGSVVYASGTAKATANGTSTYTPFVEYVPGTGYNLLVYTVDSSTWSVSQRPLNNTTDVLNFHGATLTVGSANAAPTIQSVSKSSITESDWDIHGAHIYNDPTHSIDISAQGHDDDGNPLTFRWIMTKPGTGGGTKTLAETSGLLHMTIADIASLGLPVWGVDTNMWDLTVEAFDGTDYSAPTHIPTFVPEPATMGLLAFGVVSLLKRRRRA